MTSPPISAPFEPQRARQQRRSAPRRARRGRRRRRAAAARSRSTTSASHLNSASVPVRARSGRRIRPSSSPRNSAQVTNGTRRLTFSLDQRHRVRRRRGSSRAPARFRRASAPRDARRRCPAAPRAPAPPVHERSIESAAVESDDVVVNRAMSRSTSAGSNAVPGTRAARAIASASLRAGRYGRSACSVL